MASIRCTLRLNMYTCNWMCEHWCFMSYAYVNVYMLRIWLRYVAHSDWMYTFANCVNIHVCTQTFMFTHRHSRWHTNIHVYTHKFMFTHTYSWLPYMNVCGCVNKPSRTLMSWKPFMTSKTDCIAFETHFGKTMRIYTHKKTRRMYT